MTALERLREACGGADRSRSPRRGASEGAALEVGAKDSANGAAVGVWPRRVFVARHGLKEDNVPGKDNLCLRLTDDGREALGELASFCEDLNVRFGRILCSPFLRCRETGAALSRLCSSGAVELEPGLCEVLTNRTGLRNTQGLHGIDALEYLKPRLEDIIREHGGPQSSHPVFELGELQHDLVETGPDACRQVVQRGLDVVRRLRAEHFEKGPLLLVTHGGTAKALISALLHDEVQPYNKYSLPEMGSLTVLEKHRLDAPWRIVGNVCPCALPDRSWEVHWRRGRANEGGDAAKL